MLSNVVEGHYLKVTVVLVVAWHRESGVVEVGDDMLIVVLSLVDILECFVPVWAAGDGSAVSSKEIDGTLVEVDNDVEAVVAVDVMEHGCSVEAVMEAATVVAAAYSVNDVSVKKRFVRLGELLAC